MKKIAIKSANTLSFMFIVFLIPLFWSLISFIFLVFSSQKEEIITYIGNFWKCFYWSGEILQVPSLIWHCILYIYVFLISEE
jgi:hypothetical protein